MSARCASCRYPLSVSDSVACYECESFFHIDCAQLAGFPYYDLSSDPRRNTFHCDTCKLLPLPRARDSDSDDDMPSRQADSLETHADFAKTMNEVKGTVQDLSDVCKDMFREINELKSINLTLRCCVENLRLENQDRDEVIVELKRKLEALEKNSSLGKLKSLSDELGGDRQGVDEDTERYLTPEPPESIVVEGAEASGNVDIVEEILEPDLLLHSPSLQTEDSGWEEEGATSMLVEEVERGVSYSDLKQSDVPDGYVVSFSQCEVNPAESNVSVDHYVVFQSESEIIPECDEEGGNGQDWTWEGNNAVKLKRSGPRVDDIGEESESGESEDDPEEQGWEILHDEDSMEAKPQETETLDEKTEEDEIGYKLKVKDEGVITSSEERSKENTEGATEVTEDVMNEVKENKLGDEKSQENTAGETEIIENVMNEEKSLKADTEQEMVAGQETDTTVEESSDVLLTEDTLTTGAQAIEDEESLIIAEEPAPKTPEGRTSLSPVSIKSDRLSEVVEEGVDFETSSLTRGSPRFKSQSPQQGDPRLEGETLVGESAEGRVSGGQSPSGEVQPAELPPTPQPLHTEEDLWDYLREQVTSEHPSTVAEFVQNLIGTLQHVPEEYLKPVIDANIKRVNSPTVTDGEHRPSPEGVRPGEEDPLEGALSEDVPLEAEATLAAESDLEVSAAHTMDDPRDAEPYLTDAEDADYSAVEAAA